MMKPQNQAKPRAPRGLGAGGRALWAGVLDRFELSAAELVLLEQAARARDELDRLHAALADVDVVAQGSTGQPVASPLLAASNAARGSMLSILAKIDVLDDSSEEEKAQKAVAKRAAQTAPARAVRWAGSSL